MLKWFKIVVCTTIIYLVLGIMSSDVMAKDAIRLKLFDGNINVHNNISAKEYLYFSKL